MKVRGYEPEIFSTHKVDIYHLVTRQVFVRARIKHTTKNKTLKLKILNLSENLSKSFYTNISN